MTTLVYVSTWGWRRSDPDKERMALRLNHRDRRSLADVGGELGTSPEEADRLVMAAQSKDRIEVSEEIAQTILRCQ